jgi:lipooligosaccharide transport system permease protein
MEYQKTFDAIVTTPLSVEDVVAGEILWGATRSMMTGTAILVIASAFQLVHSPWAVLIPVVCFLQGLMFASIATLFTSVVPAIYSFNYYTSLFITPMFFFSGVFFPLSSFPQVMQNLSQVVPLTPAVRLTRALTSGEFQPDLLLSLAFILGVTALFTSLSLLSMRRRLTV